MDMSDDELLEKRMDIANAIIAKINAMAVPSPATEAINLILGRIVNAGSSLRVLLRCSRHNYSFDTAAILRTVYDAMLQGLYILAEPQKQDERAHLFLDFIWVEEYRRINLIDKNKSDLAEHLRNSPMRAGGEPEIIKKYNKIKSKFLRSDGKVCNYWYCSTLENLAKSIGLESEYEYLQKFLSGVIHSSPFTLLDLKEGKKIIPDRLLMDWYLRFELRVLGAYAEYKKVALDQTEKGLIEDSRSNVLNLPRINGENDS